MNKYQNIVDEVKEFGIAKSHISDLLDSDGIKLFNEVVDYYNEFLSAPHIVERCNRIASGNPIQDRNKWYEVTHYEFLNRPLNLDDSIVKLYMQNTFIDIAEMFYGELPRVRNILTWVHPMNAIQSERNSQRWHRDQEDFEIFKVFINFSDIGVKNGPTQFIKETQHGGRYGDITNNMNGGSTSDLKYNVPESSIVDISGPAGTIHFINTNGVHKGGLVQEGVRCLTQANYLKPSAPAIQNNVLGTFDCYPKIGNYADINSDTYKSLSDRQLHLIS